jgi:putative NADH-flavin reductase
MRISVIGAAGRLGGVVVAEAARRGHDVTGLARSERVLNTVDGLTGRVVGDARDRSVVASAIDRADAVVCTLTGGTRNDTHQARDAASALTEAMTHAGVSRLVVTSAYPIVAHRPLLVMSALRRIFATPYADTAAADSIVAASELAWTIVRLNRLTNQPSVGHLHVTEGELVRPTSLARPDVGVLLVDLAESDRYAGRAVSARRARRKDKPPARQPRAAR